MLMQEEVDGVVCGSRLGTVVIFSCALTLSFSAGRSLAGAVSSYRLHMQAMQRATSIYIYLSLRQPENLA